MALSLRSLCSDKLIKSSSLLFVAAQVSNVFNYAFQIVMGRMLTPKEYGLMNALLALFAFTLLTQADMVLVSRFSVSRLAHANCVHHAGGRHTLTGDRGRYPIFPCTAAKYKRTRERCT